MLGFWQKKAFKGSLLVFAWIVVLCAFSMFNKPQGSFLRLQSELVDDLVISHNALVGIYPGMAHGEIRNTLIEPTISDNAIMPVSQISNPEIRASVVKINPVIARIIECESQGNPQAKNPNSTAYGLCQFINGTWEYVQLKWDMKLDRDNPEDQLYACDRLYKEEGKSHWITSYQCWK